jgi:hypothetical protein
MAAYRRTGRINQLLGKGLDVHWPDLDEDLSVAGLLRTGGE